MGCSEKTKKSFLQERGTILKDIKNFLVVVFWSLKEINEASPRPLSGDKYQNLNLLIESLCFIHSLYGYPANNDENSTERDKQAVKKILKDIKRENKTFGHYYEDVNTEEFWQFSEDKELEDQPREPAHLFLELVREIFDKADLGSAALFGKTFLESLSDQNKLKPSVWAKHEEKPAIFGVSLGVQSFVRPIFIYIKLVQLRTGKHGAMTSCKLSETRAFEAIRTGSFGSKYEEKKEPCSSCQAFFGVLENQQNPSFPPFGNCAEYDVIQTRNLNYLLTQVVTQWDIFKKACQEHFKAFKSFLHSCESETMSVDMDKYLEIKENNSKILKYQQNGQNFELKAVDWQSRKPNRKRKLET